MVLPPHPAANILKGILWMTLAVVFGVLTDAIFKHASGIYAVIQVVWARFAFQMLMVLVLFAPNLGRLFVTQRLKLHLLRSILLAVTSVLFVAGLRHIRLAEASAILFLAPFVVAAVSGPLLGERVGRGKVVAVCLGFLGALVVIRPGLGFLHWAAVFPAISAVTFGLYQVTTRELNRTEDTRTMLLYTGLAGTVILTAIVPFQWSTPDPIGWVLLSVPAALGGLHHFAMIRALKWGPAATIAPFDYSRLIWAAVLGFVVFDELPDGWTVLGAAIIAASGLYLMRDRS